MILITVAMLIGLVLSLLLGVSMIDFLRKKELGQYIREEAPERHLEKKGTPTMGGAFVAVSILLAGISSLFMAEEITTKAVIVLVTFIFFTFAGFQDDIKKVLKHQNKGLSARGKLLLQIAIALLPTYFVVLNGETTLNVFGYSLQLGWLYPIFAIFLITGASNAVNLTDGLDGLAGFSSLFAFIACTFICYFKGDVDIAIICAATVGALIGFLYYNRHPAKIFMGDTGSLALGGLLGTVAVISKFELWLILIGIIFIIETCSVIIQVINFKLTGKRVFKMSPIHHHFELSGWSEEKIVKVFSLITCVCSLIAVGLYYILG